MTIAEKVRSLPGFWHVLGMAKSDDMTGKHVAIGLGGAVLGTIVGFFTGRAVLRAQMKSAISDALTSKGVSQPSTTGGSDAWPPPAPPTT